jgi:hypothetical protein
MDRYTAVGGGHRRWLRCLESVQIANRSVFLNATFKDQDSEVYSRSNFHSSYILIHRYKHQFIYCHVDALKHQYPSMTHTIMRHCIKTEVANNAADLYHQVHYTSLVTGCKDERIRSSNSIVAVSGDTCHLAGRT